MSVPAPTEAELRILRVLWAHGPATVREVHEAQSHKTGYTTVLKLMQIMTGKGLLERDDSRRSHVYAPLVSAEEAESQLVEDVIERVFEGSASRLVMRALEARAASPEELDAIRALLDEADG